MKSMMKMLELMKLVKLSGEQFYRAKRFTQRSDLSIQAGGFTLLEMVVAVGLFGVILIIAVSVMFALSNAELKSRNIQNIQDNLRFALESMTKELRTGVGYLPSGGAPPAYSQIAFTRSDGVNVGYCLSSDAVQKLEATSDCSRGSAVTSNDVIVERLIFYVIGNSPGPSDGQPRVTVALRARSRNPRLETRFDLQTTITQRIRDQ